MKKIAASLLVALALVGCGAAMAANESLVSLAYLNKNILPGWEETAAGRVESGMAAAYDQVVSGLRRQHQSALDRLSGTGAGLRELRVKRDDRLVMPAGSGVVLWAGRAVIGDGSAPLVDVTEGCEAAAGNELSAQHRYLAAGSGETVVRIASDTAVISMEGDCRMEGSGATDYNALADALKAMGIFRGGGHDMGSGYDLEKTSNRLEGLVMFIRMIGEEQAALAFEGENPFSDVPPWAERYGAYAHAMGYANGRGGDGGGKLLYDPYTTMGAAEYMTLVLRALGYTDGGEAPDFQWNASLSAALDLRVLNPREHKQLTEQPFYRAQIAYLCYFNLSAQRKDGGTLLDHLTGTGSLDRESVQSIMDGVAVPRM